MLAKKTADGKGAVYQFNDGWVISALHTHKDGKVGCDIHAPNGKKVSHGYLK